MKLYSPISWIGFNYLKTTEALRGDRRLNTKSQGVSSNHLIDHERIKGWVDLGDTKLFRTQDVWIGSLAA